MCGAIKNVSKKLTFPSSSVPFQWKMDGWLHRTEQYVHGNCTIATRLLCTHYCLRIVSQLQPSKCMVRHLPVNHSVVPTVQFLSLPRTNQFRQLWSVVSLQRGLIGNYIVYCGIMEIINSPLKMKKKYVVHTNSLHCSCQFFETHCICSRIPTKSLM